MSRSSWARIFASIGAACCTSAPTAFCFPVTNVRYDSTSTLEQGFPFFSTGSHSPPLLRCCRKATRNLDTRPVSMDRAAYRVEQPLPEGQASPCVRPKRGQDGLCTHVVPFPCESRTQHQPKPSSSVVCRCCPVLASPRSSLDKRVELVIFYFCAADRDTRPSWPGAR